MRHCAIFWPHELEGLKLDDAIRVDHKTYNGQVFYVASSRSQIPIDTLINSFPQEETDPPRDIYVEYVGYVGYNEYSDSGSEESEDFEFA